MPSPPPKHQTAGQTLNKGNIRTARAALRSFGGPWFDGIRVFGKVIAARFLRAARAVPGFVSRRPF